MSLLESKSVEVYGDGYTAYCKDEPITTNPYPARLVLHGSWNEGWMEACTKLCDKPRQRPPGELVEAREVKRRLVIRAPRK